MIGFNQLQEIFQKPKASFSRQETSTNIILRQKFMQWKQKAISMKGHQSRENGKMSNTLKLILTRQLRTAVHRCYRTYFRRWKNSKVTRNDQMATSMVELLDQAMVSS